MTMPDDMKTARVAYLQLLKSEFNRIWPHGQVRSSEVYEYKAFREASAKIVQLTRAIEEELL